MSSVDAQAEFLRAVYEDGRREGSTKATITAIGDFLRFVDRMPPSPARDEMRDWLLLNLAILKTVVPS